MDEGTNHGAEKEVIENDFLAPHAPRVVVAFEVCDNGIGIARDKLKLIFMPFGQASVSSTREYGGTGLGLAITNNIVQSVGGTITCSSELEKGTTMVLSVPLEVRNKVDTARLRQLDPETRVLSVIAKRSLANAIDHTTGDGFDGSYIVSNVTSNTFTVTYPFSRTASGNVSLLPEVRLRSL